MKNQQIIYFEAIFQQMSQKFNQNFQQNRQSSGSSTISFSIDQSPLNQKADSKIISFKSIILEVTKILANQSPITGKDIQKISSFHCLSDLLLYFRYSPKKTNSQNTKFNERAQQIVCSKHFQEIKKLKIQLLSKKQVIIQLNQGYQEVKQFYEHAVKQKNQEIALLKKQICYAKAQNQILKQKIDAIHNYREKRVQDLIKLKEEINHKILISSQQSKAQNKIYELKKRNKYFSLNNSFAERDNSEESKKSEFSQIKCLIQDMSTKLQNVKSSQKDKRIQGDLIKTPHSCHSANFFRSVSCNQNSDKYSSISNKQILKVKHFYKKQSISANSGIYNQKQLMQQMEELRSNQSKLLDKIVQRDQFISQLVKTKSSIKQ